uniref:Uncharacterized protein n=1 Tax=Glossina palpalis gambiensis TaxID=67801 RepID=A0A1B0BCF0_9MUSC
MKKEKKKRSKSDFFYLKFLTNLCNDFLSFFFCFFFYYYKNLFSKFIENLKSETNKFDNIV